VIANQIIATTKSRFKTKEAVHLSMIVSHIVITHGVVLISRRSAGAAGAQWLLRRVVKADSVLA